MFFQGKFNSINSNSIQVSETKVTIIKTASEVNNQSFTNTKGKTLIPQIYEFFPKQKKKIPHS